MSDVRYSKKQYYTLGEIKLPVPDGYHYSALRLDKKTPNGDLLPKNNPKYSFIVSKDKISTLDEYKDGLFGYSLVLPLDFDTKSWYVAPISNLVSQFAGQLDKEYSSRYGVDVSFDCFVAQRFFTVLWAPFMAGENPKSDEFWMSITFTIITKSKHYSGTAFANGSVDKVNYTSIFKDFISRIQPAETKDINDDGLLENPTNLKNLIEAFGGTVVDYPKDNKNTVKKVNANPLSQNGKKPTAKKKTPESSENKKIQLVEDIAKANSHEKDLITEIRKKVAGQTVELKSKQNELTKELETAVEKEKRELEQKRVAIQKSIDSDQETLEHLSFIHISQKKAIKAKIETDKTKLGELDAAIRNPSNSAIASLKRELVTVEQKIRTQSKSESDLIQAAKKACNTYTERLKAYYSYHYAGDDEKPILLSKDPSAGIKEHLKTLIREYCSIAEWATVSEIKSNISELSSCSVQEVADLLRQMVEDGALLRKTVKGKAYFSIGKTPISQLSKQIVIDDRGWDISQKPSPPSLTELL